MVFSKKPKKQTPLKTCFRFEIGPKIRPNLRFKTTLSHPVKIGPILVKGK